MKQTIRTIIVDDESKSRAVLRSLLEDFSEEIQIIGEAENVEGAYKLITLKRPQLVFLDIQMPRQNGFELLKKFDKIPFEVIFVTSFDKYAINAIKFNALDYLLKPVEVHDLRDSVNKAIKVIEKEQNNTVQILNLLHSIDPESDDKKLAVHLGDSVRFISSGNIVYIESDGSYCNLTTVNNERYTTAKYLKDYEDYFTEDSTFLRIHKSFIINTLHIKEYSKGEPCIIKMINGKTFEVSRRKKQEVLEKLKKVT